MKQIKDYIGVGMEAFIATWAFIRIAGIVTTNVLTVFAFVMFYCIFNTIRERKKTILESVIQKRVKCALSILFTILYVLGDFEQIYAGLDNLLFRVLILSVTSAGFYIFCEKIISILLFMSQDWNASKGPVKGRFWGCKAAIICLVCWIPYLLKNFPGVMTIDSMNQFAQVIGIYAPSNHHPYMHTLVMKLFYNIGYAVTGDRTLAIAFYTIAQIVFMAACVGYLVNTLLKIGLNRWILGLIIAFYALVPYNALYAVTVWKDSMFAGGVLLYVATLLRFLTGMDMDGKVEREGKKESIWNAGMLLISGMLMCLFRTNGWYAFLVTFPFVLVVFRKQWKRILGIQFITILLVLLIKGPLMDAMGVIQPDLIESLSIPAQQLSRVIVLDKPISEEQDAFLNHILDTSKIEELYNPYVSDGFKRLVRAGNQEYLREHFNEFLKVYVEIGMKYPADYLIAFRDQSIGYWFPMQEGIIAGDEGVIPNEFGVENRPILKGKLVIKINEIGLKLKDMVPGYGILWSMGAILWLILLSAAVVMIRGDRRWLLIYVPAIAIVLTLVIATPVAKEFRYAYAYIYCLPLYLLLPFMKGRER